MAPEVTRVTDGYEASGDPTNAAQMDATELESRQQYWRYCLLSGLALLIVEALVAAVIESRRQPETMV